MHWIYLFVAAVLLLLVEVATGTFYLLVMSMAFLVATAINAIFHTTWTVDALVVILISSLGFAVLYMHNRAIKANSRDPSLDLNENIGAGATVRKSLPNGEYLLDYRGTTWTGVPSRDMKSEGASMGEGDSCTIVGQHGNKLIVEPRRRESRATEAATRC